MKQLSNCPTKGRYYNKYCAKDRYYNKIPSGNRLQGPKFHFREQILKAPKKILRNH